jgi:hypothetical protein
VYAYRGDNHTLLWKYPIKDVVYHGTAIHDIDNDSKPELVLSDYSGTVYVLNGENGTLAWDYCYNPSYYCGAPITMGDLDGDAECEVIFSCWFKIGVLRSDSSVMWTYDIPDYESAFRGVALADLDGDQLPDLLFGTSGGLLIALKGTTGDTLWTMNLRADYGNSLYEIDHAPVIADFDQDGVLDAFIIGGHAEYPAFSNDFGRGYAVSLDIGVSPGWEMFQKNIQRNPSLCESSIGIESHTPGALDELTLSPNPASEFFTIDGITEPVQITATEITGKIILKKACNEKAELISTNDWPAGMYVLRITGVKSVMWKKVVVEK